ncbi:MAG TPA: ABC transporter ATP-binding protein [Acidimicrobiales bacterium]
MGRTIGWPAEVVSDVALDGVTKRFGAVTAVDQLSLQVADGELLVLLGPSGCGKTTALRMIAGLEEVTSGEVSIGGRVVNDVAAKDRDVAMVFQSYALYPHMTVARNIESPMLARKMAPETGGPPRRLRPPERRERVAQVAESLGLADLLDRKPAALSGGQRQRGALARAIVARPAAFLMDEPLSNLDAQLRAQTRLELVELHRRLATTFVYVTHDQVEAMTMADRIALMNHGRLQQIGPPQEVYDRPQNLFVADFLGSPPMNTVPATVHRAPAGPAVRLGDQEIGLAGSLAEPPSEGTAVVVGIRPEHLTVDPGGDIDARVTTVESLGHERLLVCDVDGHRLIVRQPSSERSIEAGTPVSLRAQPDRLHLFDPETTERLG